MYIPQKSSCIVLSRGTEVVVVDVQKYILHDEVIPPLILSSPQERPVLELECGSVLVLAGNETDEISAAASQNFPLIEWPNLFTTKWKGISCLLFSCLWKFTCCKFNEIQISPKKTWKVFLCFQLLRQNTSYSITVLRKKKLNIIIYVSGQKIFLVWNFISF